VLNAKTWTGLQLPGLFPLCAMDLLYYPGIAVGILPHANEKELPSGLLLCIAYFKIRIALG
jgi:hypothetical protein